VALLPAWLFAVSGCGADTPRELVLLGQPGPWPWVSDLVAFGERLWLANSVKHREHNSADLYSFDPRSSTFRYERHLFSQGVGKPVVSEGRLYWPLEDPRFHLGVGQLASTDGEDWELHVVETPRLRHVHAGAELDGRLWLAASFGGPVLLASADAGRSWQVEYAAPDPLDRIDRILRLEKLGSDLYGYLLAGVREGERTLVRLRDGALVPVPDWPGRSEILSLAAFRGWLYASVRAPNGGELWRTDGSRSERVHSAPQGVRDLASDGKAIWALCARREGGSVWRSSDGRRWVHDAELPGGLPREIQLYGGEPYVAGRGPRRRGALWGPPPPRPAQSRLPAGSPLPARLAPELDWAAAGAALDRALADPESYAHGARGLIEILLPLALAEPPQGFFTERLRAKFAAGEADLLEGRGPRVPLHRLGPWALFWAIAVSGQGPVPVEWISTPWSFEPNEREKYFEPAIAALAAASWTGQGDLATLEALVNRLDSENDPDWLTGDVIGALSALTEQRFGYDVGAWKAWWQRERGEDAPSTRARQ
jgi:hypothetical protein